MLLIREQVILVRDRRGLGRARCAGTRRGTWSRKQIVHYLRLFFKFRVWRYYESGIGRWNQNRWICLGPLAFLHPSRAQCTPLHHPPLYSPSPSAWHQHSHPNFLTVKRWQVMTIWWRMLWIELNRRAPCDRYVFSVSFECLLNLYRLRNVFQMPLGMTVLAYKARLFLWTSLKKNDTDWTNWPTSKGKRTDYILSTMQINLNKLSNTFKIFNRGKFLFSEHHL